MKRYKAVLFASDGTWVTDFKRETREEVIEALANRGSRWYFYPLGGVILDKGNLTTAQQRVVDMAYPLEHLKGKSIKSISKYLEHIPEEEFELIF